MGLTDAVKKKMLQQLFFQLENTQFQPNDWKIFCYILELFSIMEIKQTVVLDYSSGKEKECRLKLHAGLCSVLCYTVAAKPVSTVS